MSNINVELDYHNDLHWNELEKDTHKTLLLKHLNADYDFLSRIKPNVELVLYVNAEVEKRYLKDSPKKTLKFECFEVGLEIKFNEIENPEHVLRFGYIISLEANSIFNNKFNGNYINYAYQPAHQYLDNLTNRLIDDKYMEIGDLVFDKYDPYLKKGK